jgi:hypothetical protein
MRDEGRYRRISIRGQVTIDASGLQRMIYDLESGTPFLFVDNLRIRAPVSGRAGERRTGDAGSTEDRIAVNLDVYGYVRASK